jgi:AcrR family transcriptional regulator
MALTAKGRATRQRIVEAAADRILAAGVGGTSLDDVRAVTGTSKSQLFHYFPEGKAELVRAVGACQADRVLDAQRPALEGHGWAAFDAWRDAVLAHYRRVGGEHGCPVGSLTAQLAPEDAALREQLAQTFEAWRTLLADAVALLREDGLLREDADADALGTVLLAAVEGGLVLSQARGDLLPLEQALDGALAHLRAQGTDLDSPSS